MKSKPKSKHSISRRKFFPALSSAILFPLFGLGQPTSISDIQKKDKEYQTLLKSDGTAVKVKVDIIKKSKIIEKNISNRTFLSWLGRKL